VIDFVGSTLFMQHLVHSDQLCWQPPGHDLNKNVLLVTVAATALIGGASLASAQTMNTEQPKASAPMKPDSEKAGQSAQSPKKDAEKPQTTGQAPKAEDTKKPEDAKKA
jgi:hypothetical protein